MDPHWFYRPVPQNALMHTESVWQSALAIHSTTQVHKIPQDLWKDYKKVMVGVYSKCHFQATQQRKGLCQQVLSHSYLYFWNSSFETLTIYVYI